MDNIYEKIGLKEELNSVIDKINGTTDENEIVQLLYEAMVIVAKNAYEFGYCRGYEDSKEN